jgi:predicted lipid carrier protein YhbT
VRYLSQVWLDETRLMAADQPAHVGASGRIQYMVTGGPDGDVKYSWELEDGRLLASHLGTIPDPDVTVTAPYAEWVKIARGELDMSAAFMQGVVKVAGDTGKWLLLLPITRTHEYTGLQAEIRAITEYPDA